MTAVASAVHAIQWIDGRLRLLDQRLLPLEERYFDCRSAEDTAAAIHDMVVRGAPAIGIAAAFGLVLAARANPALFDEAEAALRAALAREPGARFLCAKLAQICERSNRLSEARQWLAQVATADVHARHLQIRLDARDGDPAFAVQAVDELLRDFAAVLEVNPDFRAQVEFDRGRWLDELKRYPEALAQRRLIYQRLTSMKPPGDEAVLAAGRNLALALVQTGDARAGRALAEAGLRAAVLAVLLDRLVYSSDRHEIDSIDRTQARVVRVQLDTGLQVQTGQVIVAPEEVGEPKCPSASAASFIQLDGTLGHDLCRGRGGVAALHGVGVAVCAHACVGISVAAMKRF